MRREWSVWFLKNTAVTSRTRPGPPFPNVTKDTIMTTPIPEFLWLRDYEERLEFASRNTRDRSTSPIRQLNLSIR